MSGETLEYHYEKHHKGYMTKLEKAISGTAAASRSLEDVIRTSDGSVFDNAAQVYNHTFFWESMKPGGGGEPPAGNVRDVIDRLGGFRRFRERWVEVGTGQFGSGYVWLVVSGGEPDIVGTANAQTPLTTPATPVLTADVWEHAYYLDHRNARQAYLEAFCDDLINWEMVAERLPR
jgi:Fe-Mn family superoxide dismutase